MKYYIPTSSLNLNNILSTESISPKIFYDRRGFGYTRWFSVEENAIEHLTLLYDTPHMFERPQSEMEDHPMLIEIDTDEEYPKLTDGVYFANRTIYFNPWQTKFFFFSEKNKTTALSLSDNSLETKLVRLYQRKMIVKEFVGSYHVIHESCPIGNIDQLIEYDYVINKMKGLLYGYYIGANLSSTKANVQKLDALQEIKNIFSSVISSYDKKASSTQYSRLNELFDYIDSQHPIYRDLEKEIGNKQLVNNIINILKKYWHSFPAIDRDGLVKGLQDEVINNPSIAWVNGEINSTKSIMDSSRSLLDPDKGEIIVSSKDKVISQKAISDKIMSDLFISWTNNVLCSKSFTGKINSIKETLSDEITNAAKNIIASDWENSPIRTYLNGLRRHVRGEEFNPSWDNGLLSSLTAVLVKGDEWEQLLNFMQAKGMYDYRIAFAIYGVLNGFANMTRDFTDLLLNKESTYLSKVYREIHGQLFEKSIPISPTTNTPLSGIQSIKEAPTLGDVQPINSKEEKQKVWQDDIRRYAKSIIKRDKKKLLNSLEKALAQNGERQDYFIFIKKLADFEGWKPGKTGPSVTWKRMQEKYVPDYDRRIKPVTKQDTLKNTAAFERDLFDKISNDNQSTKKTQDSFVNDDKCWIIIQQMIPSKLEKHVLDDLKWFQGEYKKGKRSKYYAKASRSNKNTIEAFIRYLGNKEYSSLISLEQIEKRLKGIYVGEGTNYQ